MRAQIGLLSKKQVEEVVGLGWLMTNKPALPDLASGVVLAGHISYL